MEPIRPDDDELRAGTPYGGADSRDPEATNAQSSRGKKRKAPAGGSGSGRGNVFLLWLLIIGLAGLAVAGWYTQNQRIVALESQVEEADYWARQSKLALARFEGELSETGENLQERGASLAEQIAANDKALESANSEIRKLWVVANERNKGRLNEHQSRLADLESAQAEDVEALAAVKVSVDKARSSLAADIAAVEEQMKTSIVALQDANRQATEQLTTLSQQMADVDQVVENRIRRFEQEQKLGIRGMEGRIAALEKESGRLAGAGSVQTLKNEVASLKRTIAAVDASRSQLTSRLIRLSEEVNELRSRMSGQ
ncbi:hypothetical protein [Marinobacter sp.]|uniref:hypothetical protein n=1 Tax=Marinobacter sp. TaxID=50741 RepID=UPI00235590D6|nr:hypothetical protein [Marinobacter sp.]